MNTKLKRAIGIIFIYVAIFFTVSFGNFLLNNPIISLICWGIFLLVIEYFFEEDTKLLFTIGIAMIFVSFFIYFSALWITQKSDSFIFNKVITDNMMIVFLTAIYVFATILNVLISTRNYGLSRLPRIDFLLNENFYISMQNRDNTLRARDIIVTAKIIEEKKEKKFLRIFKSILSEFKSFEGSKYDLLPEKHHLFLESQNFFLNSLKIKKANNGAFYPITDLEDKIYRIQLKITYASDTGTKILHPIIKNYRIIASSKGTQTKESPFFLRDLV